MISIRGLEFNKTCDACPEQYDVFYGETQVGYVRFRFGCLRADYPDCGGEVIFFKPFGDEYLGGFESEDQRMKYLKIIADKIWENMGEEKEDNYEGCMLVNNCNYKTATCRVCEPDDGCYPYRYIKKIIEKENAKMEVHSD